jgi:ATP-dependent RNA/DNA helicase IGHMBP2
VAVTRARRHCAIFCDTETVSKDPFLQRLVQYFEAHGQYSSVAEFEVSS